MPRGRPRRRSGRSEQDEKAREEAETGGSPPTGTALTPEDRERVWAEALAKAPPFLASRYRRHENTNPEQAEFYWQVILGSYLGYAEEEAGSGPGSPAKGRYTARYGPIVARATLPSYPGPHFVASLRPSWPVPSPRSVGSFPGKLRVRLER